MTGHDANILAKDIEEPLRKIYSWTLKWRMKINICKTEICLFNKKPDHTDGTKPEVILQDKTIKYNPTPKLLEVVLD